MSTAVSRREFLKLALVGAVAVSAPTRRARAHAERSPSGSGVPRYAMIVFLRGGIDPVYTTDPKRRREVDRGVDVPYGAGDIIEAGPHRFGPHLAQLAAWAPRLAVVNGVHVNTANHETGALQMLRLRTHVTARMPGILDVIGAHRDNQPLATVSLGNLSEREHSPLWFGAATGRPGLDAPGTRHLLDLIDDAEPADYALLARVLRRQAAGVGASTDEGAITSENLRDLAALFERLDGVPRFRVETWSDKPEQQRYAADLQRALWLFENDLTRCVYLKAYYQNWDSHYANHQLQVESSTAFFPMFARFLDAMAAKSRAARPLLDQTTIVCGSELGRFPRMNGLAGKDHFPEAPYLFLGAGIGGAGQASFGASGRQMEALPVSLATGRPGPRAAHRLTLDDVGTTLLQIAGIDPLQVGYRGELLRFLMEGAT